MLFSILKKTNQAKENTPFILVDQNIFHPVIFQSPDRNTERPATCDGGHRTASLSSSWQKKTTFKKSHVLHRRHLCCVSPPLPALLLLTFLVFHFSPLKKKKKNPPYWEQTGCFCGQPSPRLCLWRGADNKGAPRWQPADLFSVETFFFRFCFVFIFFFFLLLLFFISKAAAAAAAAATAGAWRSRARRRRSKEKQEVFDTFFQYWEWCPDSQSGGISGA